MKLFIAFLSLTVSAVLGRPQVSRLFCPESTDGFPVFIPHPTDCTKYYECDGDWPILMDCAPPLFFDPSLNVCNWPEMVDCQQPATTEAPATTEEPATTEAPETTEEPATTSIGTIVKVKEKFI